MDKLEKYKHEMQLDTALRSIPESYAEMKDLEINELFKKISSFDPEILAILHNDKNITQVNVHRLGNISGMMYVITPKGKRLLSNGGYYDIKIKEEKLYKISIDSLDIAKKNFKWTKFSAICALIAILVAILAIILTSYCD